MDKEELTKFLTWYRKYQYRYQNESEELTINHYTDFVNYTRRSERRADGSNRKAKEVCVHPYKYVRFDLGRKKHYCHKCRCYLKQTD